MSSEQDDKTTTKHLAITFVLFVALGIALIIGANIIGCKNVTIRDSSFSGHDDALVFKSDYALGRSMDTENVEVRYSPSCFVSRRLVRGR